MLVDYKDEDDLGEMDPIEAEVDAIRRKLWEEVKDMTPEEHTAYVNAKTEPLIRQFHMKVSRRKPAELIYTPQGPVDRPKEPYEYYDDLPYAYPEHEVKE